MKQVIDINLADLDSAIDGVEKYKQWLARKSDELEARITQLIAENAQEGYDSSVVDDLLPRSGGPKPANVFVDVEENDNFRVVVARGDDAIWVEFGAGVYHNGPIGGSPNPWGEKTGYVIGSYSQNGFAERNIWGYREGGELFLTHGTKATMPLYHAMEEALDELNNIVQEVFSDD